MIPHYVLGCDELPERKAAALAHFAERGVPVTYFRGYHGRTWGLRTVREYEPGKRLPVGHVGLNLSVWALWQHLSLSAGPHDDTFACFEDDAVLPTNYQTLLDGVLRELTAHLPEWDLVFLGLAEVEPHVWNKVTERIGPPSSRLCRMSDPFGTHAYLVRRRALSVLLDHMAVAERNLDQQLWERVLRPGKLTWCAVLPSLVRQRTFDYVGSGKPEWEPSTLFLPGEEGADAAPPRQPPPPATVPTAHPSEIPYRLDVADAVRLAGGGNPTPAVPSSPVVLSPLTPADPPGRPSAETVAASSLVVDPYPCIYRGEFLEDGMRATSGRTVPVSECARLNTPCHSKASLEVPGAVACEACRLRVEMAPDTPRARLPIPDGHFNPSIAVWGGRLILATRDSWGHSKVALWHLTNARPDWTGAWAATPIGSYASGHAEAPRLEDPRLFIAVNPDTGHEHLHAAFNLPDGYPPKRVQVGYVRFARDLSGVEYTEVFRSPAGNMYEKNWVPFGDRDGLHWVYSSKPEHLVLGRSAWATRNDLPWTGGVIRGGASPVRWDAHPGFGGRDVYYHFFHGCLRRLQGSVYTAGCLVFDANPPYQVLKQTPSPLLWPDLPAPGEEVVKRYVLWPGGAVAHAGRWHLALGIDDSFSRIVSIPFADVDAALADVPETANVTSIRATPMALGIPETEFGK